MRSILAVLQENIEKPFYLVSIDHAIGSCCAADVIFRYVDIGGVFG
jgi:hypothetical protein